MSRIQPDSRRPAAPVRRGRLTSAALLIFLGVLAPALAGAQSLAITFDDLPLNGTLAPRMTRVGITREVLAILKHEHIPQVYGFVNALRFEGSPDGAQALQLWVSGGERVGNHTYSHADLDSLSAASFLEDVRRNEPVLELLDPGGHWQWLRYPYMHEGAILAKRLAVRAGLKERGYQIAQVTISYEDYLWNSPFARCSARQDPRSIAWLRSTYLGIADHYIDADRQLARILFGRAISHVLVLHLGAFSPAILPDLLHLLRKKGFTFVTLQQAEQDPIYATDVGAGAGHSGTLLEQLMDARGAHYPPVPPKPYKELQALCQ